MPPDGELAILTEADAAALLTLSVRTLQRLRVAGGGPEYIKLTGRRVGYMRPALLNWLERRAVRSTSQAVP